MSDVNTTKETKNGNGKHEAKPQVTEVQHMNPHDLIIIGLDTKDGEDHPLYDDRIHIPLDGERVMSYAKYGVREPITAKTSADRKPVVIDGRQRVRYARAVYDLQAKRGDDPSKRITVPVMFVKGVASDAQLWGLGRQLNIHDKSGGLMVAREVAKLLALNGRDYKAAALDFGKTDQWVRDMENVALKLAPEAQMKILSKELTMTAAIELAGLTKSEQKEVLADIEDEGAEPSVAEVKKRKAAKQGKQGASPRDKLERIETACRKFAGIMSSATKDDMVKTIDYIAKQAAGTGLVKMAAEIDAKED